MTPLAKAKKAAWTAFSLYVRLRDSDWRGDCTCVTCGKTQNYRKQQAGHFVQGRHNSVLFDPRNCHVQCPGCNLFKNGNLYLYGKFMEKKYGQEVIDELFELDKQSKKYTEQDFRDIETKYKELCKALNQ